MFLSVVSTLLIFSPFSSASDACTVASLRAKHPNFCEPRREAQPLSDQQMASLFGEVQGLMSEFILAGRRRQDLSVEERSLLTRIETVKFEKFEECGEGSASVNASYSTTSHQVRFCSGLRSYPVPALVAMIGHEIGHSADSCSCQSPHLHAPDRRRLSIPALPAGQADPGLAEELQGGTGSLEMVPRNLAHVPQVWQNWVRQGLATVRSPPMPLSRYPLNGIRTCLIQSERLWEGSSPNSIARSREGQGCHSMSDYEGMADVWGAFALEKYFERHPEKRGDAALGMFESRKNEICSAKGYPNVIRNLESIWIARPGTARALGCTPVPERRCLAQSPFRGPARAAPARAAVAGASCQEGEVSVAEGATVEWFGEVARRLGQ